MRLAIQGGSLPTAHPDAGNSPSRSIRLAAQALLARIWHDDPILVQTTRKPQAADLGLYF